MNIPAIRRTMVLIYIAIAVWIILVVAYGKYEDKKLCDSICHRGQCVCVETCPRERGK